MRGGAGRAGGGRGGVCNRDLSQVPDQGLRSPEAAQARERAGGAVSERGRGVGAAGRGPHEGEPAGVRGGAGALGGAAPPLHPRRYPRRQDPRLQPVRSPPASPYSIQPPSPPPFRWHQINQGCGWITGRAPSFLSAPHGEKFISSHNWNTRGVSFSDFSSKKMAFFIFGQTFNSIITPKKDRSHVMTNPPGKPASRDDGAAQPRPVAGCCLSHAHPGALPGPPCVRWPPCCAGEGAGRRRFRAGEEGFWIGRGGGGGGGGAAMGSCW